MWIEILTKIIEEGHSRNMFTLSVDQETYRQVRLEFDRRLSIETKNHLPISKPNETSTNPEIMGTKLKIIYTDAIIIQMGY